MTRSFAFLVNPHSGGGAAPEAVVPVARALRDAISRMQRDGRHGESMDPAAMSGVLVSMLANVAGHRRGLEDWGVTTEALQDAMARIIFWAVSGRKSRSGG